MRLSQVYLREAGALETLFRAGISRLQAALTPNTTDDLDALLSFVAPQRGGAQAVNNLITQAKQSPGPLTNDWWDELFMTLNIADENVKRDIRQQVSTEFGGAAPAVQQPTGAARTSGRQSASNDLRGEFEKSQRHRENVAALLQRSEAARTASASKLADLNARLDKLLQLQSGSVSEAGLADRLRTMAANPNYAKSQVQRYASQSNNERMAKLAIQISVQHLRQKFNDTLAKAGLRPDDIIQTYNQWKQLRATNPNPAQLQPLEAKLKKAFALFSTKRGGGQVDLGQTPTPQPVQPQPVQPQPVQPQPPPAPQIGASTAGQQQSGRNKAARSLARKLIIAAAAARDRGENPIVAAHNIAKAAYKIDPTTTRAVWRAFVNYLQNRP